MSDLVSLKNIGPKKCCSARIGRYKFLDDLFDIGVEEAYRRVRKAYPDQVSFNMLYALQGALLDLPWNELPEDMRSKLRQAVGE
jgi:DNA transformation protein